MSPSRLEKDKMKRGLAPSLHLFLPLGKSWYGNRYGKALEGRGAVRLFQSEMLERIQIMTAYSEKDATQFIFRHSFCFLTRGGAAFLPNLEQRRKWWM